MGSVLQAIDVSSGAVLQELEYDTAGVVTRNTSPALQPFTYAGGLVDVDGRFVHFGARDYDPRTGRWLEPDPIGAAGRASRYAYVEGDPVNRTDISGLCPLGKTCRRDTDGHLSTIDVHVGQEVTPGQKIGETGNTGGSTGPHLHYEVGDVDANGNYTPDQHASPDSDGCPLLTCDGISSKPAGLRCLVVGGVMQCRPHNGTDIKAPEGTPVCAPRGGKVVRSGWQDPSNHKKGYGQRVTIDVVNP